MKTIEQELADIIYNETVSSEWEAKEAAKVILSSGLVIPVSALDRMVDKVAVAIGNVKPYREVTNLFDIAQAAINAIKQEVGK